MSQALNIDPIVAQLLINRGIKTPEEAQFFLTSNLEQLHDPFLFKDMYKAVERIKKAATDNERVMIFGDYDVDGVTSSVIMYKTLKNMGIDVINHIPHRLHDGYGLNEKIAKEAKNKGVALLVTVDCGITSLVEVGKLNAAGIDVVIFDHHEPLDEGVPDAVAVVNPKQKECRYPFKKLAAVGIVGRFVHAITGSIPDDDLDLIALGTIADVVPLVGENRLFVKAGLPRIAETKNKGLAALLDVARLKGKKFRSHYAGFILGPRINASGRMASAQKAFNLLVSEDHGHAYQLAQYLEKTNTERQKLQRNIFNDAVDLIEKEVNFKDHNIIVIGKEGWHKGVLGIVASKVMDMYARPAVIISLKDGVGTASARSMEGFPLYNALQHCSDMLENFGGHKLAAGLTIKEENIVNFRDLINRFARDTLQVMDLVPSLKIDQEINLKDFSMDLIQQIDLLDPYGEGNPQPVFCARGLKLRGAPRILGRGTLKFWVTDGRLSISAVGFGMASYIDLVKSGHPLDLAFELSIDDWNKAPTMQLKIRDIKLGTPID